MPGRPAGSKSAAVSQPRSSGNSPTASVPPATRSQSCDGVVTPPGYRQPIPMMAIGSLIAAVSFWLSALSRSLSIMDWRSAATICSVDGA